MGKARLMYFSPKCSAIIPLSRFQMLSRLVMTTRRMRVPSKVWQNLGQFPHLPENRVTRRSRDIKITPYHRCKKTFLRFSFWSRFLRFLTFFIFQTFFIFKKRWQSLEREAD